jgi:uncharacterized membrane protein
MSSIRKHLFKCLIAGIAALLPIGGTVLMVLYFERQLSDTWLKDQPFYQFGMGIAIGFLAVYLVGLAVSSFLGRWLWGQVDLVLMHVPLLGSLYQTFKQLLGYGEGPDAMFKRVVMVPCEDLPGEQLGFVTAEISGIDGSKTLAVFLPAAPNPTNGRLIYIRSDEVSDLELPVSEAMKSLISVGALPLK